MDEKATTKRIFGMVIVSNEEENSKQTNFDTFQGIILCDSPDGSGWKVLEGYFSEGNYQTRVLGAFPEEKLNQAKDAEEMAKIMKRECLKLFHKKIDNFIYPEFAIDVSTAQAIKARNDIEKECFNRKCKVKGRIFK